MGAMRQSWSDERLDHLNEKVDRRFDEVDRKFDEVDRRFDEVHRRFDEVDRRLDLADERFVRLEGGLDSIQRSMIYLAVSLTAGMLAGFGGMATLLATQI